MNDDQKFALFLIFPAAISGTLALCFMGWQMVYHPELFMDVFFPGLLIFMILLLVGACWYELAYVAVKGKMRE